MGMAHDPRGAGSRQPGWQEFILLLVTLVVPTALTLSAVGGARAVALPSMHDAPLGYTRSLSLFGVPLIVLSVWARRHRLSGPQYRAVSVTLLTLILLGFGLEWSLGASCFFFPNAGAVTGLRLPVIGGASPVEEFLFFALGFPTILLTYLWADLHWLNAYHVPDSTLAVSRDPILRIDPGSALVAAGILAGALSVSRRYGSGTAPVYFLYLYLTGILPTTLLMPHAHRAINWRALSLTLVLLLLISVIWEACLGVPYGWWGYRAGPMLGVGIGAWSNLPIEEPILWTTAACATATVYESARTWFARREPPGWSP